MKILITILKFIFSLVELVLRIFYEGIFGGQHTEQLETGYNAKFIDEDELYLNQIESRNFVKLEVFENYQ